LHVALFVTLTLAQKTKTSETEPLARNPIVAVINSIVCMGLVAMLVSGIVLMSTDDPSQHLSGKILVAVSGAILGVQCCLLCLLVICYGAVLGIAASK